MANVYVMAPELKPKENKKDRKWKQQLPLLFIIIWRHLSGFSVRLDVIWA